MHTLIELRKYIKFYSFNLFLGCKITTKEMCENFHLTFDLAGKYIINTSTLCERWAHLQVKIKQESVKH